MTTTPKPPVPTLALTVAQACNALNVSYKVWRAHIEPDVKIVRVGSRKVIAVSELQRYLDNHGETVR